MLETVCACMAQERTRSKAASCVNSKKQTLQGVLTESTSKRFFGDYADQWLYTFKLHSVEDSSFDKYESAYLHAYQACVRQDAACVYPQ